MASTTTASNFPQKVHHDDSFLRGYRCGAATMLGVVMAIVATSSSAPVALALEPPPSPPAAQKPHAVLVERGASWLRRNGCRIVLAEFSTALSEIPDVIGWKGTWGDSFLIECKASRGDFLADKAKGFRREPHRGVGQFRYYLCPPGMIKAEELPPQWGLLYAHPKSISIEAGANPRRWHAADSQHRFEFNQHNERRLLLSALTRLHIHHGQAEMHRLMHATYEEKRAFPRGRALDGQ